MISDELLHRYGVETVSEVSAFLQPTNEEQTNQVIAGVYSRFLMETNSIIVDAFEKFLNGTSVDELREEFRKVLDGRQEAREYLEGE